MRCFIAIEVPEPVRDALTMLIARLRDSGARAGWADPATIHLTLRFLGDIDPVEAERLGELLAVRYRGHAPIPLHVRGTGAFPNAQRPAVVWAGAGPVEGPLASAQAIAEDEAVELGLPREKRPFTPHLTLARIRDPRQGRRLMQRLAAEPPFDGGGFTADAVSLFSSELTPRGAIHRCLRRCVFA